jgi:adenylylsulfate kinase
VRLTAAQLVGQGGLVIWFTGLSGAGKTTLATAVQERLRDFGYCPPLLDGDVLRRGLCRDLGFSAADRQENVRRAAVVAGFLAEAGLACLVALISPFHADRKEARASVPEGRFLEVFVDAPLAVCEHRDVKGLYRRARENQITDFTGISSPYELPESPEIAVRTDLLTIEECAEQVVTLALEKLNPSLSRSSQLNETSQPPLAADVLMVNQFAIEERLAPTPS